jgi:hypothetical protein
MTYNWNFGNCVHSISIGMGIHGMETVLDRFDCNTGVQKRFKSGDIHFKNGKMAWRHAACMIEEQG